MDIEALRRQLMAEGKLSLKIRVIPKSRETGWAGTMGDGALKAKLAAAPEKGKANEELVRFLAAEFEVRRQQVEIVAGASSHTKQVRILRPA